MQHKAHWKEWSGMVVIIVAAVFMELILGFQYNYARRQLERELERSTMTDLLTSSLRIQEVLSMAEVAVRNEVVHAEAHLNDPEYLNTIISSMVSNDKDNLDGAFFCFEPNYYPKKGYWYEPYAFQNGNKVTILQMGSAQHDYTQREFYRTAVKEGFSQWTDPYWDGDGAENIVLTYAVPITENGVPVGVLGTDLTTHWINNVVNNFHPHPSSFSMVLTQDGKLISAPSDSVASESLVTRIVTMFNDSTVERKKVGSGRVSCFLFYDEECDEWGRAYYLYKAKSPHWPILLVCYDKEVFGELDRLRGYMFIWAMVGLAVLALIVWLFIRSTRKLHAAQLEQARISAELRVANEIQQSMLPPHAMHLEDADIYGSLVPAREVGGDLYDYFVRDEKLFFCIGDVSGKGAASAMLMAVTKTLFRSASAHVANPARIMQTINESAAEDNDKCMFVTLFIGVLDLPTGRLRYCNAGHDCPYVLNNAGLESLDCDANLPVGAFEDTVYSMQETTLPEGSLLFLYTDGLTEAKNMQRAQFGSARVEETLGICVAKDLPPDLIIAQMTESVHQFVGEAEQSDDLTMLLIRYTPVRFESTIEESLVLKNDIREIKRFSEFIKEAAGKLQLDPKLAGQLRLAMEEAVVNVIDYAYPVDTEGEIHIDLQSNGQVLRVIISDAGEPFDPTAKEKTDTTLSAEERQIGGLGILLVRELMDSINYERNAGRNILTLTKKIQ